MHSEMGAFFYFILIFICRIIIFFEINYETNNQTHGK